MVIVVERRRDGKLHPVGGRLRGVEWNRAVNLAHQLHCRDGLSYRKTAAAMLENLGIRRSVGQVFADIASFTCDYCRQDAADG